MVVVDHFLEKLNAGNIWFPLFLRADWQPSHLTLEGRLVYKSYRDKDTIRAGIALIFEHLKDEPVTEAYLDGVAVGYPVVICKI